MTPVGSGIISPLMDWQWFLKTGMRASRQHPDQEPALCDYLDPR